MIPTYKELKTNGWPEGVPGKHSWMLYSHIVCCAHCGFVQRKDGKSKPCRGKVSVGLRNGDAQ